MQTIEDLNNKITYRIAKVLYVGTFVFIFSAISFIIYDKQTYYPYNETKTGISCANRSTRVDVLKTNYNISGNNLTLEQKKKIAQEICGIDPSSVDSFEIFGDRNLLLSKNNFFTASQGVMEKSIHITNMITQLITTLIILLVIFEIIRRISYYIILGTFKPQKK